LGGLGEKSIWLPKSPLNNKMKKEIQLTNKTEEEIEEIKKSCPKGHEEKRGEKVYWVFNYEIEYGV